MEYQKLKVNIMITFLLLCSSIILGGCGTNWNVKEYPSTAEPTEVIAVTETEAENTITSAITPTITPMNSPEVTPIMRIMDRVIENVSKDLDGNKVNDSIQIFSLKDDSETCMHIYLNGYQIFEYKRLYCKMMGVDSFEYLDLDGDSINEIFIAANTNANGRPYEEVMCLKQTDGKWDRMDYPKNEFGFNGFAFKITRGKNEFDFIISSEDTNQIIQYDASQYFIDDDSGNDDTIQSYRNNHYKEGDEVGALTGMGIWEAKVGTYEERNCIIALHAIEGPYGHSLGQINICFAYNEQGKVDILNVEYLP